MRFLSCIVTHFAHIIDVAHMRLHRVEKHGNYLVPIIGYAITAEGTEQGVVEPFGSTWKSFCMLTLDQVMSTLSDRSTIARFYCFLKAPNWSLRKQLTTMELFLRQEAEDITTVRRKTAAGGDMPWSQSFADVKIRCANVLDMAAVRAQIAPLIFSQASDAEDHASSSKGLPRNDSNSSSSHAASDEDEDSSDVSDTAVTAVKKQAKGKGKAAAAPAPLAATIQAMGQAILPSGAAGSSSS